MKSSKISHTGNNSFKRGNLKYQPSFQRRVFSLGGTIISRFLFNLNFNDTQAGAKFMKREVWDNINQNFTCTGFEFDIELLYKAKKKNARIKEYFMLPRDTNFSTVRARILPRLIYNLLKLRLLK